MTTKTILLCTVIAIISIACKPTVSTEGSSKSDTISCADSIYLNADSLNVDSTEIDTVQ